MLRILRALLVALALFAFLLPHVRAQETSTVYGYVHERNPQGVLEPRQGITVELYVTTRLLRTTLTNSTGLYRFEGLAPGSYKLEFKEEGYTPTPYAFELAPEVEVDIYALIFDNSIGVIGGITGLVFDEYGQKVEDVRLKLSGIDTKFELTEEGSPDGFFGLSVPLGTYILTIEHPDYERWSEQITLRSHEGYDLGSIILSKPNFIARNLLLIAGVIGLAVVVAFAFYLRIKRRAAWLPPQAPQPGLPRPPS